MEASGCAGASVGSSTHTSAISEAGSHFSMWYFKGILPSAETKRRSEPSGFTRVKSRFPLCRRTSTGTWDRGPPRAAPPAPAFTPIFSRCAQSPFHQACACACAEPTMARIAAAAAQLWRRTRRILGCAELLRVCEGTVAVMCKSVGRSTRRIPHTDHLDAEVRDAEAGVWVAA